MFGISDKLSSSFQAEKLASVDAKAIAHKAVLIHHSSLITELGKPASNICLSLSSIQQ